MHTISKDDQQDTIQNFHQMNLQDDKQEKTFYDDQIHLELLPIRFHHNLSHFLYACQIVSVKVLTLTQH